MTVLILGVVAGAIVGAAIATAAYNLSRPR